ncbi:actin cytoskeleton-regulatory complex protein sla1 [Cornus florida]|uniref:actin cytoskeleton-regulatory complex protein sla1 n=1 Tax=Cornus florida TaxID=4283 RepID=UPI0028A19336|nr:actin cytoskeleton-regulatory complex protein sla1 [Cornus florida]
MKTHQPKLKTTPGPLFSCGFFRHCTQTVLSPTTSNPPTLPPPESDPPPPPPPPHPSDPLPQQPPHAESESSSSSNTSQSFTQWRFPLSNSPISHHPHPPTESDVLLNSRSDPPPQTTHQSDPPRPLPALSTTNLQELFHVAELELSSESHSDRVKALYMLERSLVPNPPAAVDGGEGMCPAAVMKWVVGYLKEREGAKPATKILLALCLAEGNRHVAVEAGAVAGVVEALADLEGAAAERALAALELLCMVAEGAAEVRAHALAVPMLVQVMGKMAGRGKEYAISVLAVIYSGESGEGVAAPPEQVARAVVLALQGDCTARGRRKGAQLLKTLEENERPDLTQEEK